MKKEQISFVKQLIGENLNYRDPFSKDILAISDQVVENNI